MSRGPDKQFDPEIALSKAMEVFWARGYEAASLSELLEHMEIGRKSMYDTFGNKRSLFLKALEYYAQTQTKSIRDRLAAPGSPLANLESVLQNLQIMHARPGSKGCMIGTNIADFNTDDAEMAAILQGHLKEIEDAYYKAITQAQAVGELDQSTNARDLARLLLCTTQGMALLGRVLNSSTLLQGTVRAAVALLKAT
ncbi:MAG: helix-turn-helix transcriptional regulator [Cyanobacteria bacterium CRU_2_1]|nr:helix-turn-helix transcriptional regulator [Cyanobacteria bacterium CRU_2_1]